MYKQKYIKYKQKYHNLKNIIHVSKTQSGGSNNVKDSINELYNLLPIFIKELNCCGNDIKQMLDILEMNEMQHNYINVLNNEYSLFVNNVINVIQPSNTQKNNKLIYDISDLLSQIDQNISFNVFKKSFDTIFMVRINILFEEYIKFLQNIYNNLQSSNIYPYNITPKHDRDKFIVCEQQSITTENKYKNPGCCNSSTPANTCFKLFSAQALVRIKMMIDTIHSDMKKQNILIIENKKNILKYLNDISINLDNKIKQIQNIDKNIENHGNLIIHNILNSELSKNIIKKASDDIRQQILNDNKIGNLIINIKKKQLDKRDKKRKKISDTMANQMIKNQKALEKKDKNFFSKFF